LNDISPSLGHGAPAHSVTPDESKRGVCANCSTRTVGVFCHACGQRASVHRLTVPHLLHEVPHALFHLERGIVPTLAGLVRRPGKTINDYLNGQRVRYFNPLTLLMLLAGLTVLLSSSYPLDFSYASKGIPEPLRLKHMDFVRLNFRWYSATLVFYLPAIALLTFVCFAGRGRSYGEHLVINAFAISLGTLAWVVLFPVVVAANGTPAFALVVSAVTAMVTVLHWFVWRSVFSVAPHHGRWWATWLRAAVAMVLYVALVTIVPILVFKYFYSRY
jgi:Protein of unknown function (DUF3667)